MYGILYIEGLWLSINGSWGWNLVAWEKIGENDQDIGLDRKSVLCPRNTFQVPCRVVHPGRFRFQAASCCAFCTWSLKPPLVKQSKQRKISGSVPIFPSMLCLDRLILLHNRLAYRSNRPERTALTRFTLLEEVGDTFKRTVREHELLGCQ